MQVIQFCTYLELTKVICGLNPVCAEVFLEADVDAVAEVLGGR